MPAGVRGGFPLAGVSSDATFTPEGEFEIRTRRLNLRSWGDAALVIGVAVGMASLTWRGWADPLVDFGREAYVPWRLSQGAHLYSDVAWFNGPLSQYWNALWFRMLGPGMSTLWLANALVLGATLLFVGRLVVAMAGRAAALLAVLVFLSVFGFGQYVGIANYNWMAPYAHELTHGVALALASVVALATWRRAGSGAALALGGLALGLCFLTKVETFLAGAVGSGVLLVGGAVAMGRPGGRAIATWLGAFALPIALSIVFLGLSATLGAWPSVLAGEVAELPFYRVGLGLDAPRLRVEETLAWGSVWVIGLGIPVAAAWLARETRSHAALPVSAGTTLGVLLLLGAGVPWTESLRPLQLFVGVALAGFAAAWVRTGRAGGRAEEAGGVSRSSRVRCEIAMAFGLLGLVLLLKMLFNVRSEHYGFALAAPATAFAVAVLWHALPAFVDRAGWRGDVVRGSLLAILVMFCTAHVRETAAWMERKTEVVGTGRDAFRSDLRGAFVQLAVDHVRGAGYRSVAVLPEGVMINYLARVPNPTPYLNFMPPEEILFGDEAWAASFRASPPDAIVIVPKDTSEYGRGGFGIGYGRRLQAWIDSEYVASTSLRLEGVNYEIRVLVRRNPPT